MKLMESHIYSLLMYIAHKAMGDFKADAGDVVLIYDIIHHTCIKKLFFNSFL